MFEIKNIDDENYKNFIENNKPISFLQNFEWGEVEKELGREVYRLGIFDKELIGVCQIIGYKAKRGNFLGILHGPIIKEEYKENFVEIIKSLLKNFKSSNLSYQYSFLRANFLFEENKTVLNALIKLGFRKAPRILVTENFWVKELNKSEEKLLNEASSHHKKLILESLNKDYIEIEKTDDLNKIQIFLDLYKDLSLRKKFTPYSENLIKKEFEIFAKNKKAFFYLGKMENKYYSAALIILENDSGFYHHGASIPTKEPVNYRLHFEIIQDLKRMNLKFYNMWGITEKGPKHPWYGLTQFKKGFGGKLIKLLPTLDYPFSLKYYFTYLYEKYFEKAF